MADHQDVDSHFTRIATRYDELYGFVYERITEFTVKYLQLKPDDLLADIGGGTGGISHLLWKKAGLKAPVLCVEPNAEMLREAEKWEGVKPYHGTADDFFSSDHHPKYNKILMNESAHLFPDPLRTFQEAAQYLPADGMIVLIGRGTVTTFPVWKSLREKFGPPEGDDALKAFLEQAGFGIQTFSEMYTTEMTKGEWYDKIRRRIFSALNDFSDEQIEEGLKEVDREWFPAKKDSDTVEVNDKLFFYIAMKS